MAEYDQSLLYHSIRIYDGTFSSKNVKYRIGNTTTTVKDEVENYYDTWDDFHMIPSERPTVALPKANTKLVSIPGNSKPIDMTRYLTGHETFSNRSGSWSFITDPEYIEYNLGGWIAFDKQLRSLFHGRVAKVVLRDDPTYFYAGELTMGQWQTGTKYSTVRISYNLYPYKKAMTSSMDLWKWDDFSFKDGIIMYTKDLEVVTSRIITLYGGRERISPHISAGNSGLLIDKYENSNWIAYGSIPTASIAGAKSIIPRLIIDDGENKLRIRGNGTVTIDYRRGLL